MYFKKEKKDFENFIKEINYGYSSLNEKNYLDLDEKGYTIINCDKSYWKKNDIDFDYLVDRSIKLCKEEGNEGGWENGKAQGKNWEPSAQRISNLTNKDPIFLKLSKIPDLLNGVNHVIKNPFKISSLQIRNPLPYSDEQKLHIDWRPRLFHYYNYNQCTGFIYLDDADEQNGTIHIYPGTHKKLGEPNEKFIKKNKLKPVALKVKKYNILLLNIYTWHYGGKNYNGKSRKTIFANYRERSELQQLNQKKFLDEEIKSKMSEFEKYLYAIRKIDKNESDWVYKNRNNSLIKLYQKTRDIFYHKFIL